MRSGVAAVTAALVLAGCPVVSRADDECGKALENYTGTFAGEGEFFSVEVVIDGGKATTTYSGYEEVTFKPAEVTMFDIDGEVGVEWTVPDYGDFFGFYAMCVAPPEVSRMTLLTPDDDVFEVLRDSPTPG